MAELPPSLAVVPNIPYERQTLEQLRLEADYWQSKLDDATCWGAAVGAASGFLAGCEAWIRKRERDSANG